MPKYKGRKTKKFKKMEEQRSLMSRRMQKGEARKRQPLKHQRGGQR